MFYNTFMSVLFRYFPVKVSTRENIFAVKKTKIAVDIKFNNIMVEFTSNIVFRTP